MLPKRAKEPREPFTTPLFDAYHERSALIATLEAGGCGHFVKKLATVWKCQTEHTVHIEMDNRSTSLREPMRVTLSLRLKRTQRT